jgi:hypothetical protein
MPIGFLFLVLCFMMPYLPHWNNAHLSEPVIALLEDGRLRAQSGSGKSYLPFAEINFVEAQAEQGGVNVLPKGAGTIVLRTVKGKKAVGTNVVDYREVAEKLKETLREKNFRLSLPF